MPLGKLSRLASRHGWSSIWPEAGRHLHHDFARSMIYAQVATEQEKRGKVAKPPSFCVVGA
jgi:hypothetical protein